MPDSNRNRHSRERQDKENRTGEKSTDYQKLDDKLHADEDPSTRADFSNPKYSKTDLRKEEKEDRRK